MKGDIFISYSRKDHNKVKKLIDIIENSTNLKCWRDLENIESGVENFDNVIVNAINECRIFLFILSDNSQKSEFSINELELARKKQKENKQIKVVILNIDNCKMKDTFYLRYNRMNIVDINNKLQFDKFINDIEQWGNHKNTKSTIYKQKNDNPIVLPHLKTFIWVCIPLLIGLIIFCISMLSKPDRLDTNIITQKSETTIKNIKYPTEGANTTISTDIQNICTEVLNQHLKNDSIFEGWAMVMEVSTGDIKAAVNLTHWEDSVYLETTNILNRPTLHNSYCSLLEPAAIFNPVILTAILDDKILTKNDSVLAYPCKLHNFNGITVRDEIYRDNGSGKYSMSEVLRYGSSIGMVQYTNKAYRINRLQLISKLNEYGIFNKYNIFKEEQKPILPQIDNDRAFTCMSYGYYIATTGINMLVFYNTIANNGKMMKPRIIKNYLDQSGNIYEIPIKSICDNAISKTVAKDMTDMLIDVVNAKDGVGKRAKSNKVLIAGTIGVSTGINAKTGTYEDGEKKVCFCGFFPADNPQYSLFVQINERADMRFKRFKSVPNISSCFKDIAERIVELNE